jgi:hypothetical protein
MRRIALLTLVLALAAVARADAAERRVPQGWLGVTADGPFDASDPREWDRMVAAGVETVRTSFYWARLQPFRSAADVPPGETARFRLVDGVPTDFASTDAIVIAAAQRGLTVLPVVEWTPDWAAARPGVLRSPPARAADVKRLFRTLVERYGPEGSLWAELPALPRRPLRHWQVYNEPNLKRFWPIRPYGRSYVRTLRAAERGIHSADPSAIVVLAGLTGKTWNVLGKLYKAGAAGAFDAVALHTYTALPANVPRIARYTRRVMRQHGDGKLPIWVTELSWPAAAGEFPNLPPWASSTDSQQARLLDEAIRRLVRVRKRLRIGAVLWFSWLTPETTRSWFDWSGLRRIRGDKRVDAPALRVFRGWARRLEGCSKQPGNALACA